MNGSIYDLYQFYLEPRDLKEKAHLVTIESVRVEEFPNQKTFKKEKKLVLRFVNRRKAMILNKTQAGAVCEITGTDEFMKWKGSEVVLVEDATGNGKKTIRITTREDSGDMDLMFPKQQPVTVTPVVPAGWWNTLEEHGKAVLFAARVWNVSEAEAWGKLSRAVRDEAISAYNPPEQFMEWVQIGKVNK